MKYFTAFLLQKHTWAFAKSLHPYRQEHHSGWKSETEYPYPPRVCRVIENLELITGAQGG